MFNTTTTDDTKRAITAARKMYSKASDLFARPVGDCVLVLVRKRGVVKIIRRMPKRTTIRQAWEEWLSGAEAGTVRNRSGDPFKPSALRAYRGAMRLRVLPELGDDAAAREAEPELAS